MVFLLVIVDVHGFLSGFRGCPWFSCVILDICVISFGYCIKINLACKFFIRCLEVNMIFDILQLEYIKRFLNLFLNN